jgi:hypothetical protein
MNNDNCNLTDQQRKEGLRCRGFFCAPCRKFISDNDNKIIDNHINQMLDRENKALIKKLDRALQLLRELDYCLSIRPATASMPEVCVDIKGGFSERIKEILKEQG